MMQLSATHQSGEPVTSRRASMPPVRESRLEMSVIPAYRSHDTLSIRPHDAHGFDLSGPRDNLANAPRPRCPQRGQRNGCIF
jgi:hypothetical protein